MSEDDEQHVFSSPRQRPPQQQQPPNGGPSPSPSRASGMRARRVKQSDNTIRGAESSLLTAANENSASQRGGLGGSGEGERCQAVFLRHESEVCAMGPMERFKKKIVHVCKRTLLCQKPRPEDVDPRLTSSIHNYHDGDSDIDENDLDTEDGNNGKNKQYRLSARRRVKRSPLSVFLGSCCCGRRGTGHSAQYTSYAFTAQKNLAMYLHWMFRINFFFLFALSCVVFFAFTFIFAGIITIAGNMDAECVRIGGEPFGSAGSKFADAFALSWTTFSTVGYGSTYPALGHENENPSNCLFITVICSLESFVGVLYSGFCGAILFGKVLRIQSHAQVLFSDPIVIRYGTGVMDFQDEDAAETDEDPEAAHKLPCPVLEFRVVNRLFNEVGGEIMDTTLNCVANIDADDADPKVRDAADPDRQRWLQQHPQSDDMHSDLTSLASSEHGSDTGSQQREGSTNVSDSTASFHHKFYPSFIFGTKRDHQTIDEDPTNKIVSKRIFSKLLIEASDHPFFKRVWLARHVLDDTSPLLTPKARKLVRKNGGYWPERLNSSTMVRKSLQFNQILVSLNGVSNVSASDVYAQKIYDFVDMSIGYQFVNLLFRDEKGVLKVDTDLINDVREQNGGGGEPLLV